MTLFVLTNPTKMKQVLSIFILGICCLFLTKQTTAQSNVIKLAPGAFVPFKKVALSYERVITDRMTINLRVAPSLPTNKLPLQGIIENQLDDQGAGILSSDINLNALEITPELRFYTNKDKGALRGFYLGPFFRFSRFNFSAEAGEFTDNDGDEYIGNFDGNYRTLGGGLIMGVQGLIKDRVAIDFYFGPGYAGNKLNATLSDISGITAEEYQEVADEVKMEFDDFASGTPLENFLSIETSATDNSGTLDGNFGSLMFRLGLAIGIAF